MQIPIYGTATKPETIIKIFSVADPDPGSSAFLTPGSGIRKRFYPDPGSRIYNSLKIDPNFFLQHFKYKTIFYFV